MLVLAKLHLMSSKGREYLGWKLPTASPVAYNETARLAIVDVPDEDVPEGAPTSPFNAAWIHEEIESQNADGTTTKTKKWPEIPDGPVQVVKLIGAIRNQWRDLIRGRYQEGYSTWEPDDAVEG